MSRKNSIAMVVIPGEPPGKQLCSFLRGLCRSRSKLIVVGESGGLGPGDLLALLRCQLPDVTNFEVIDMTEVHGESVAEAIDACQSQGLYRNGQALEVFCSPENARSFATEIRSGHLDVDPTVITVHPQQIPSDDKNLITRAVMSGDKQALAQALDPHIMSDPEEVGRYRSIILGEAAWPQPDALTKPPPLPEIIVPAGTVLYHGTSSAKDFSVPRGPASFTPSVKVAKYYADHEGEGVRPRVLKFVTTRPIRCLDHPGAMDDGKAQYWLQRFATEKLGWSHRGSHGWDMVGYARMPGFLQFVKKAGFQGLRLEALDSGGVEVCVFDPGSFVKPMQEESLVREFLVDIAPSRDMAIQVLHDLLATKLKSVGMDIQSAEYLGSGRNGSAYRLPDGLILKVTTDPAEAESGRKLVGQPMEYIHLIHGVTQLSERVWLLAQEGGLEKLPPEYSEELDTTVEALEAIGAGHALREGDWQQVVDCIETCSDPGIVPLLWEVIERFGIEGMCHEVRRLGLAADIHSGNIMLREGIPILTDLGTAGDPPQMQEMAEFRASEVLDELIGMGWVPPGTTRETGEGGSGMIFPSTAPDKVVKVTEDPAEYQNASKLRGKDFPGIARVFRTDKLKRDKYAIELERLHPLDDETQDVLDQVALQISRKVGRGTSGETDRWLQSHPQIAAIIGSARKAGFAPDVHGGNIMQRNDGSLALVDLGPLQESVVTELLKDIGGEAGALKILQTQAQVLTAKGINIANLHKLGQGQMGVAFRIGNGKVLKVSTDKAEVDTAMTLLGKSPRHVVGYHDIFPLQEGVWGLITDECQPLSQQEEYDIMDVAERLRDERVIDDVATKNWTSVVSAVTAAVTEDSRAEGAGLSKIDGIVNRIMADFLTKAKKYQFPEMIDELRSLGVQFADYKPENIMKKSGRYVIVDLSMSKSGNNGIGEAVGVQAGPMAGTGQTLKGAGSSAWSGGRGTLADPVNHVPEDENETEQDRSLDWGFYSTSLR